MAGELDLEERIRAVFDRLSPSHRRLVEYLLESDSAAAFSTARQIADALSISESTVVRIAPELGFEGFPALQAEFQRRLMSRIEWQPPLRQAIESLPEDPVAIMRQVLENDIRSIQSTLSSLSPESFQRAVDAVMEARTVYLMGLRTSAGHALYSTMRLRLIRPRTQLLSPHFGDLADQMLAVGEGDLLIAISYHRYAADTVRALRFARSQGAGTIAITDNPVSPPAKAAEIVLLAQGHSTRLFHSLVAPMSVLNALIAAVAVLGKENASGNIARSYEVLDEFDVFVTPGRPAD